MGKHAKVLLLGLKMLFSLGLLAFLVTKFDVKGALRQAQHADSHWLWLAVGVFFLSNLIGSWLWGRLLRMQGVAIPFHRVAAYYFVGLFFNNFLPANIAGDFARTRAASQHADSSAAVFSATLMDRILGSLAVSVLAVVACGLALNWFHDIRVDTLVVAFFAFSLLLYLTVFHRGLLGLVEKPFRALQLRALETRISRLMDEMHGYRDRPLELLGLLGVGVGVQLMRVFMHFATARALGLHVPVTAIYTFVPILAIVVMLPVSMNGIGVREGAAVLLFRFVHLTGGQSVSWQLLTWLLAVVVSLLGGLIFILRNPLRAAAAWHESRIQT